MDAKYRTSRVAVLDAMASAHIYQDSLRIGACRPTRRCSSFRQPAARSGWKTKVSRNSIGLELYRSHRKALARYLACCWRC